MAQFRRSHENHPAHDQVVFPTRLVGLTEIAAGFQISKQLASKWVAREDFPQPVEVLACGRIWQARRIEHWAVKQVRKGER